MTMLDSQTVERLSLLRAKGGKKAAAYWLLRKILRIDTDLIYAIDLADFTRDGESDLPEGYQFLRFENREGVAGCDPTILEEIGDQSGRSVFNIVADGGRVYAIVHGTEVVCQVNVEFQRSWVDTPLRMMLEFGEKDAILSFGYTKPSWRRRHWIFRLRSHVCALLSQEGWLHCVCGVHATNVKEALSLHRSGWKPVAFLYTTTGGRLLGVVHRTAARDKGICVHAKLQRERI
jgi:hypothetical protein